MDPRAALATLLETSDFFTDEQKVRFLDRLPRLSDEEVHQMGVFLAHYLKQETLDAKQAQDRLNALLGDA